MRARDSSSAFIATWPAVHLAIDGKEGEDQSVSLPYPHQYMGDE